MTASTRSTVKVAEAGTAPTPSDTKTFKVTVANVAPVVTAAADQTASEGTWKSFNLGSFTDPGDDGPWAVKVKWGDGSADTTFTEASPGRSPTSRTLTRMTASTRSR